MPDALSKPGTPDEHPPLGKFYIAGFANDDQDFPIIAVARDPRAGDYREPPVGLTACPDTAYSNHVFVNVRDTDSDRRVLWLYKRLPGPVITTTFFDRDRGDVRMTEQEVAAILKVTAASVSAGGTGGSDGTRTAVGTTGTGTKFQASVTVSGGAITAVLSVTASGYYTLPPTDIFNEPVTGTGIPTGAKLSLTLEAFLQGSVSYSSGVATVTRYEPTDSLYVLRYVVEKFDMPGGFGAITKDSREFDAESNCPYSTSRQLVYDGNPTASASEDAGALTVTTYEPSPWGDAIWFRVTTTFPANSGAHDSGSAIEESQSRPFMFPGWIIFSGSTPTELVNSFQLQRSRVVTHKILTWFVNSATKPSDPTLDWKDTSETIYINGSALPNVLHDNLFPSGGGGYLAPSTSPSATTYSGSWVGTEKSVHVSVTQTRWPYRWKVQVIKVVMM